MAGLKPFFLTGANAKIRINGKTLAYCTNFSCQIQVMHQAPKVLGMYEGVSVEPLSYNVAGAFSVVKYVKDIKSVVGSSPDNSSKNDAGDGVGNWGNRWGESLFKNLGIPFSGNDGRADEALDPSRYAQGTTFDIIVYQKAPDGKEKGVYNIRNARITGMTFDINKRSPGMDSYQFIALYVDGDNFVADPSGQGQNTSV